MQTGDGHNDLGGVTFGDLITSDNDKFWANTIVFMDQLQYPTITQDGNILSTSEYGSYQWLLNGVPIDSATSMTYTITEDGTYSVRVSLFGSCEKTSEEVMVTVTAVEDISKYSSFERLS